MSSIRSEKGRLPTTAVWVVVLICALPPVLNACGADFGTVSEPPDAGIGDVDRAYLAMRGPLIYTLLEWTAFCLALVTVVFSLVYYVLMRDVVTPIIGTALFLSGCLDGFQVLAANVITETSVRQDAFVPLAWTLSRTVNAVIVLAGTAPFLWRAQPPRPPQHGLRYILLVGVLLSLLSFAVIRLLADVTTPPQILSALPEFIHRPLDLIPLALYLLAAGIVLPRFYRIHRSLFARGLRLSVLPHIVSQLYAATSAELYDNAFNVAIAMKVVGYLVPLIGLLIDSARSYRAREELQATQEQLRLARDIQMRLLPDSAPRVPGLDVAGHCRFAEVIGGDYFDYLQADDKGLTVVLADVSGHDAGASLLMANTRAYLRVLTETDDDVSRVASRISDYLSSDAQGRRFVTMFLARIDREGKQIQYVGAGHEGHVFRESEVERLESTGGPLGVSGLQPSTSRTVALSEGDLIVLMTDGVQEAKNRDGALFGQSGVEAVLRSCQDRPAEEVVNRLFSAVRAHRGGRPATDDATVVVVKLPRAPDND